MILAATSGWEIAIAVGTISAAVMTSWLALSTRNLARAAGDETRANWLPVVVIETAGTAVDGLVPKVELDGEGRLAMTLVNIGRGPAVKVTATIAADDGENWEERGAIRRGRATSEALAPGGRLTLKWAKDATPPTAGLPDYLAEARSGTITYWDITNTRHETFIELGFNVSGGVELVAESYVGSKRTPSKRERTAWRLRWWYTGQLVRFRRRAVARKVIERGRR